MALVVRCCCAFSSPNSGDNGRRSFPLTKFPSKAHASSTEPNIRDRRYDIRVKVHKHLSEVASLLRRSERVYFFLFNTGQVLSSNKSMSNFQMTKLEGTSDINQRLPDNDIIVKHLSAHQRIMPFGFQVAVFILANALMLAMPFEALAETCEADNSFFNMPLLLSVALIGATVGGLLARQRKGELKRLNDQLRQINAALRRQAKIESYAPRLSYAPVSGRIPENEVIVDSRKHELISSLKSGKNSLRSQDPEKAFVEFKAALDLAQSLKDPIKEKKAARGLGASLQRQGKYREAIKYHSMVLAMSDREGEDSGNTEAYGAIADCYTELGDLEQAGKFYDKYIARLQTD